MWPLKMARIIRDLFGRAAADGADGQHLGLVGRSSPDPEVPREAPVIDPFPGEFRPLRLLGEGAFGKVWLAEDLALGRPIALKAVKPRGTDRENEQVLGLLRSEAKRMAEIRHPNVVGVLAWRTGTDGEHYLILEFIPGGSLQERIKAEGRLDWSLATRYIADVGEALKHVHQRSIIHRDIKPANILWDERSDEAVLSDFGISARLATARNSDAGTPKPQGPDDGPRFNDPSALDRTIAGTPAYMAPEAFDGEVSPALDVYSLASTLFHLVTGEVPFPAKRLNELRDMIKKGLPVPEPRFERVPEPLEQLIRQALQHQPEHRPRLVEFAQALRVELNRLLVDQLAMVATQTLPPIISTIPAIGLESTMAIPAAAPIGRVGSSVGSYTSSRSEPSTRSVGHWGPPEPMDSHSNSRSEPSTRLGPEIEAASLRLIVSRQTSAGVFEPIPVTAHASGRVEQTLRDLQRVPAAPREVQLRTGERARIEVEMSEPGHLTVFNIGPTGNLNLLYPVEIGAERVAAALNATRGRPLHILDVELVPPAGVERLFAIWSRQPFPFDPESLLQVARSSGVSTAYAATRDMRRVIQRVGEIPVAERQVAVLSLVHQS